MRAKVNIKKENIEIDYNWSLRDAFLLGRALGEDWNLDSVGDNFELMEGVEAFDIVKEIREKIKKRRID